MWPDAYHLRCRQLDHLTLENAANAANLNLVVESVWASSRKFRKEGQTAATGRVAGTAFQQQMIDAGLRLHQEKNRPFRSAAVIRYADTNRRI